MHLLKIFAIFSSFISTSAQLTLPGSQTDEHNCVLDGGYQWCESNQACQRLWETPCEDIIPKEDPIQNVDHTTQNVVDCYKACPPIPPCPRPAWRSNCVYVPPSTDECGCTIGCGNCIDDPLVDEVGQFQPDIPTIPNNCVTWYDGCNTCSARDGVLQGCTLMMCFVNNGAFCQVFTSGALQEGEVCYRYCEDNSQSMIDRDGDCPKDTFCSNNQASMGFDSCGERAHTCNPVGH